MKMNHSGAILGILLGLAALAPADLAGQQLSKSPFLAAETAAQPAAVQSAFEIDPAEGPSALFQTEARSPWKYPLIGAVAGGVLGAVFSYSVHESGASDFVGPEAYVVWTLGGAAIGAGVGWLVDLATR